MCSYGIHNECVYIQVRVCACAHLLALKLSSLGLIDNRKNDFPLSRAADWEPLPFVVVLGRAFHWRNGKSAGKRENVWAQKVNVRLRAASQHGTSYDGPDRGAEVYHSKCQTIFRTSNNWRGGGITLTCKISQNASDSVAVIDFHFFYYSILICWSVVSLSKGPVLPFT